MVRRIDHSQDDIDRLVESLKEARTQANVLLRFKNGREERGAITYQERLGRGRLIDIEREFAMDFEISDLVGIEH